MLRLLWRGLILILLSIVPCADKSGLVSNKKSPSNSWIVAKSLRMHGVLSLGVQSGGNDGGLATQKELFKMDQKLVEYSIWRESQYLFKHLLDAYRISPANYQRIKLEMLKDDSSFQRLFNAVEKRIYKTN